MAEKTILTHEEGGKKLTLFMSQFLYVIKEEIANKSGYRVRHAGKSIQKAENKFYSLIS